MRSILYGFAVSAMIAVPMTNAAMCDFEDDVDPFCNDMGMNWINFGGQPTLTIQVNHTPGGEIALYNNSNSAIGYSGPPIESLWMTSWAGFPATSVSFIGGPVVILTPGVWQEVFLGGMTNFVMEPLFGGTSSFGTFAIDDINFVVPAPGSAMLLGFGMIGFRRRRG